MGASFSLVLLFVCGVINVRVGALASHTDALMGIKERRSVGQLLDVVGH